MSIYNFNEACAIFFPYSSEEAKRIKNEEAVSHYGFFAKLDLSQTKNISRAEIYISASNVYRIYINQELAMHGPARTAHGYARVDKIDISQFLVSGINTIAVEVMTYGNFYNGYSNDIAFNNDFDFYISEILIDGKTVYATGKDTWKVCKLNYRHPHATRISHCREAAEIYDICPSYSDWQSGIGDFVTAAKVNSPVFLDHKALLPTLERHEFVNLVNFGACRIDKDVYIPLFFYEENSSYYNSLDEYPLEDCRQTTDKFGSHISIERVNNSIKISSEDDAYILLDGEKAFVGFPYISFTCDHDGIIDIVHVETFNLDGTEKYDHNTVTRLHVKAGKAEHISMEPGICRWIKIYLRGVGNTTIDSVGVIEYSYPDNHNSYFLCSDENINKMYEAAKRTLLLNTLDIFMDCPDRERGGWLCDSLWTARAAQMMLSDTRVEKEFLENFLLTPKNGMFHAFFPEEYPGNKPSYPDMTGITTWSFWLIIEVAEYIERTKDYDLRDEFTSRIEAFVDGTRFFLGKSGLLENLPWIFVDWSMSNYEEFNQPISTPANALYAYMLIQIGKTYTRQDWIEEGEKIRKRLRDAIVGADEEGITTFYTFPDSFTCDENGNLHGRGRISESGMATALWAELFKPGEAPALDRYVRDCMGPAPRFSADPCISKSQLFIGLCIRLDMLSRRGHYLKMWDDLNAIYMPQLREGPGTLWETTDITASSRCHGFASHAGVHLLRDVLGIGIPNAIDRSIKICPHTMGLRWARGTCTLPEGLVSVWWQYDGDSFRMEVSLPKEYTCTVSLPREIKALDDDKVILSVNYR